VVEDEEHCRVSNMFAALENLERKGIIVRVRTIPTDSRLLAKLVPTFADKECHAISVTDLYGGILGFLDRSSYFFFQVAPQLCYTASEVVTEYQNFS
jgi:CBS-domain-containing membrane protein